MSQRCETELASKPPFDKDQENPLFTDYGPRAAEDDELNQTSSFVENIYTGRKLLSD
jgi:hypothetical protein